MSVRDRFDRDTLNALQSIARSLERIADSMEKKNDKKSVNPSKNEKLLEDEGWW
ncbi:hypothetical protein CL2_14990 [Anaerostipes hadrus]|uniref:Uncharacterized protein n=1 Tax=Anaerostipes hadrus TaxID=649756 RepID=D4N0P6_ANAHA|nr:hypothetical protein [Anaerostipes hadrus]EDS21574.1 hypothetical protein CLOSS21_01538 [Clostridium sp. SS2/1]CBL38441.1 hypothetical protein CL2_14990 [Anaerostipes hadrus]